MKRYKKEQDGKLEVGQTLYTKNFALTVDRKLCKGCELCKLVCPREAITLVPAGDKDGKAVAPSLDIDKDKCDFHGICAVVCPFSAISISVNGLNEAPAVMKEAFPKLERRIEIDTGQCEPGCKKCEESCPLGVITIERDRRGATSVNLLEEYYEGALIQVREEQNTSAVVHIRKELCAGCQICLMACPSDAIEVTKFIEGSIEIKGEACPDGCQRCLDVCPVNALAFDGNGKVYANNTYCVYCGACLQVCPAPDALKVERTVIRHTPIESGAWNRGLERMTSTAGLQRELAAGRAGKMRNATRRLESPEVED